MFRKIILFLLLSTFVSGGQLKPPKGMVLSKGNRWSTDDLVSLWLMNEGSGNTVFDLSGNRIDLNTFAVGVNWQGGKYGPALEFPGVTQYIQSSAPIPQITDGGDITIVTWVKSDVGGSTDQFIIRIGDCGILYGNGPGIRWFPDVGGGSPVEVPTTLTADVWYNIAVTHTGIHSELYKDAINIQSVDSVVLDGVSDFDVLIGSLNITGTWDFDGQISHCYVYNRVLSPSELALLNRDPFVMFQQEPPMTYKGSVAAAPAGGRQVIMIQMSAIPLFLIVGCVLMFSKGKKAA